MRIRRLFPVLFLLLHLARPTSAQVITAGPWTGYPDGIGLRSMVMRDSFMYYWTGNGLGFFNTASRQHSFLADISNAALPQYMDNIGRWAVDKQGNLWTLVEQQLTKIEPDGSLEIMASAPNLPVDVLRIDQNGVVWAGLNAIAANPATPLALAKFTGGNWEYVNMGTIGLQVKDIVFDQQSNPLVSAVVAYPNPGSGIYRYADGSFTLMSGSNNYSNSFTHITVSNDGRIAGCGEDADATNLRYYRNGVWQVFPGGFVFPVFKADNTLWVYDQAGNVYKLVNDNSLQLVLSDAKNYRTPLLAVYDAHKIYNSLGFDPSGQLWLSKTIEGLFVATNPAVDQWEFVPTAPLLNPGPPWAIASRGDTVWIGSSAGVTRLLDQHFEKLNTVTQPAVSLWYDTIRQGLWVGSPGKVGFYQGTTQMLFDIKPLLPYATSNSDISKIVGDSKGNIWVQTQQTLLRYDPAGNWFSFDCGQELPNIDIVTVQVQDSVVWVSVFGNNISQTRLFKLEGDVALPSGFPADILQANADFEVLSDTEAWFVDYNATVRHYQNGQLMQYTAADIGGLHNYDQIYVYDDSTVFLFSYYGLYVYKNGHWYFPEIPSNRLRNYGTKPWYLSTDKKLYLNSFAGLLVIEDMQAFLDQLDDSPTVVPHPALGTWAYPNPVDNFLYLEEAERNNCPDCSAQLFTASGMLVKTVNAPLPASIDLSALPRGLYVLHLQSEGGKRVKNFKLIKN